MLSKLFLILTFVFSVSLQAQLVVPEDSVDFQEYSKLPKKLRQQVSFAAAMGCSKLLDAPDARESRTVGQATKVGDSWGYPLMYKTTIVYTVWDSDAYHSHDEYVVVDSVEVSDVEVKVVSSTGCLMSPKTTSN